MDQRAEGQTVLEREMEVLHVDVLVGRGLALAPQQQTFLRRHLFHRYVLDGETQDDRPDHAEGHLQVTVDDFWKNIQQIAIILQEVLTQYRSLVKNGTLTYNIIVIFYTLYFELLLIFSLADTPTTILI